MSENLLDTDLGSISTAFPLLAPGIYEVRVEKAEIVPTNDQQGKQLKLELATVNEVPAQNGNETIAAGARLFGSTLTTPKGKATQAMVNRNVAQIVQAARLSGVSMATIDSWHKQLEGKVLRVKVKIRPERTDAATGQTYKANNEVEAYLKN